MTTLYLAGPMTGRPQWNYPAFDSAAEQLRAAGYEVISPADLERAEGFDPTAPAVDYTPEHLHAAMRRDLLAILTQADGIAALEGWDTSRGAQLELRTAEAVGLPTKYVGGWLFLSAIQRSYT